MHLNGYPVELIQYVHQAQTVQMKSELGPRVEKEESGLD